MGSKHRLLIAINIPADVRNYLSEVQDVLKRKNRRINARWVDPQCAHLTLHFLGEIDESRIPDVKCGITKWVQGVPAFQLQLTRLGCFPDIRHPRVVWVGVGESSGYLQRLHLQLQDELLNDGFEVDVHPFSAHFTLARLRAPQPIEGLDIQVRSSPFVAHSIELMESKLRSEGPEYLIVEFYALYSRSQS